MNGLVCSSVLGQFEYRFFVRYAFFRKTIVFIFGCVGSPCVGFSLVWVSMGHNQWCAGFSLQWLLLWGTGSGLQELQYVSSALWLPGSSAQAPQLWHTGSIACGIFPHQGSHLHLQHWGGFFTTEPPGHILDSSFPHMYLVKEAGIKRPGSLESSATVLSVPSKALGPFGEHLNFPRTVSSPQKCHAVGL